MKRLQILPLMLPLMLIAQPTWADQPDRYLTGDSVDLRAFIPPPPLPGTLLDRRDRETFVSGRDAVGGPRWQLAASDVNEAVPAMLENFSAAAGQHLSAKANPALVHLLLTMRPDVAAAVNAVKPLYARPRPFLRDGGPVCEDKQQLSHSYDYPSGHTSWGTSVALVLAELFPLRADAILKRGIEYGHSRVVCGAHSISAVEAGRQAAAGIISRLHGSGRFRLDMEEARREVKASRGG